MSQKPIEAKPQDGGRLMSAISGENVGFYNYEIKRDMRRVLDREVRSEGDVIFCPKNFFDGDDLDVMPPTSDPITLLIMARHPNGKTMVIAGTATTIWRYYGVEDPLYYNTGYYVTGYYDETSVAWKEIGSGFSANARRWECETLNGYLIINNGVDLPMTYRITDDSVQPIYELRELAVASVGTIAVQNGHLLCMDIKQLKEDKFLEIMAPVAGAVNARVIGMTSSGSSTATINSGAAGVAGNIITASDNSFNGGSGFVGMEATEVLMLNGERRTIMSVNSDIEAVVDGDPVLVEPSVKFFWTGLSSDSWVSVDVETLFPQLDPSQLEGLRLFWGSGQVLNIDNIASSGGMPEVHYAVTGSIYPVPLGPVSVENPAAYARFTDTSYIDRYQNRVIQSMPEQPRRFGAVYQGSISPQSDIIEFDYPVKSIGLNAGQVTMTGMLSGNITASGVYYDGLQMLVWESAIRRFYADVRTALEAAQLAELNAITAANSTASTLLAAQDALRKSNEAAAADAEDADLAAAVSAASAAVDAAMEAKVSADAALVVAITAREEAEAKSLAEEEIELQLSDSLSNASRIEDLQHDGAAILKAVSLKTVVVLFTETAIFIGRYVASAGTFAYQLIEIPPDRVLFYRNTPIMVTVEQSSFIVYAAENQFCRFDMASQIPTDLPLVQAMQDVFFNEADPEDIEQVFAMDNSISGEIIVCFPSTSSDKAFRIDYAYNTVSTTSAVYTAGALAKFPGSEKTVFLLGTSDGKVLRYGLMAGGPKLIGSASKIGDIVECFANPFTYLHIGQTILFANGMRFGITEYISPAQVRVVGSGNVSFQGFYVEPACWHRRGSAYTSVLQSGGDAFKNESAEKKVCRYWVMLSKFSPNSPFSLTLRSGRNINGVSDKITTTVTPPNTLVAPILSDYFLSDRIEISGINNPIEITGRAMHLAGANTSGFGRRVL